MNAYVRLIIIVGLMLIRCGDDKSKDSPSTDEQASDRDMSSDGHEDRDTSSDDSQDFEEEEVVITSVPDDWARPDACNGVGETCDGLSCEGEAICQTEGDVCIPDPTTTDRPFSEEFPYCMANVCMTYEEASCFCTGEKSDVDADCALGPKAVVGLCAKKAASCNDDPCCGDLDCVAKSPSDARCEILCDSDEACDTGCCTDQWGIGTPICSAMSECDDPCATEGASCEEAAECCLGSCVSGDSDISGCRFTCYGNEDCFSNCCYEPEGWTYGVCMGEEYCDCNEMGTLGCAETHVPCCEGTVCASMDIDVADPVYSCLPSCRDDGDCDSGCCSTYLDGVDFGLCLAASDC